MPLNFDLKKRQIKEFPDSQQASSNKSKLYCVTVSTL